MRTFLFTLTAFCVMALAFWAYQENYQTQQAMKDVSGLQKEIGLQREKLSVLRAEWAYLNRPDRLRELAEINFDSLGLLPLTAEQFGRIDQVEFPQEELPPILNPVDVIGTLEH